MQFRKIIFPLVVAGASTVAATLPSQAAVITYTDRNAFLAALSSSSTDNYSDLTTGFIASPLSRTIPDYNYNAIAATGSQANGLYSDFLSGLQVLTTNNNNAALALSFTSGSPTAVGGYFFNTDNANAVNGLIAVTVNPGAVQQSVVTNSSTNFFGWIDDSGTPFTSLVIQPAGPGTYAAVDDLILG